MKWCGNVDFRRCGNPRLPHPPPQTRINTGFLGSPFLLCFMWQKRHIATPASGVPFGLSAYGSQLSVDRCGFAADLKRAGECLPPVWPSASRSPPLWRASPPPRFARLPLPNGSAGSEGLRRWVTRSVIHGRLAP